MHRVGSAGNTANSVRPRKEKRLTYILNDADDTKVMLPSPLTLVLILIHFVSSGNFFGQQSTGHYCNREGIM